MSFFGLFGHPTSELYHPAMLLERGLTPRGGRPGSRGHGFGPG